MPGKQHNHIPADLKELNLYRKLLLVAGLVYLAWWFAVHFLLPEDFNPLFSRLGVVAYLLGTLALSFVNDFIRRYIRVLFLSGLWLITLHYYYLFYGNSGDPNWVVGTYITVIAISFGFFSATALLFYSLYVLILSAAIVIADHTLVGSIFLPGLLTMLIQANIGLRSRMSLIKSLSASNERFQLLFNSTFEGVLVHQNGQIVNVNNAMTEMFGYSRAELIGASPTCILHPDYIQASMEKLRSGNSEPYETVATTKTGAAFDVEVRGKDFEYAKSSARLVTIQDIRDRKLAEKERVTALTLAENVRIRDDFISIASHELKTPLSALQLQVQLIERDLKKEIEPAELTGKMNASATFLKRQVSRLTELVDTMLDVSRISAGRFTLHLESLDLSALVREMADTAIRTQIDPPVQITVDAPQPLILFGDRARLQQVVDNLLSNAIKYGNRKPVELRVRRSGASAILEVEDHGIGIASDFTEKIFERFERAMSARNITGFGLGLYITREIVKAHGGTVSVVSRLGHGATFTVSLPIVSQA